MLHIMPTSWGNIRQTDLDSWQNTGRVCDSSVPVPATAGAGAGKSVWVIPATSACEGVLQKEQHKAAHLHPRCLKLILGSVLDDSEIFRHQYNERV